MSSYRRLTSFDAKQYRDHLIRLDSDSRYARFSGITSDAIIERYVDSINWRWCKIIGHFHQGILRGAAEIRLEATFFPGEAELAFSVEKEFQNTRVGTNLMARAFLFLRNRHVNIAHVVCLLSNARMQKLALRYRADVKAYSGDVFISIEVPFGTMGSLLAEMADGYLGWMNTNLEMALQFPHLGSLVAAQRARQQQDGTALH